MTRDRFAHGNESGPAHSPSLHKVLEQDRPTIERGIDDFLVQRGGIAAGTDALRVSIAALRRHIYLEQEFLFPPLRRAGMDGPVFAMSFEHQDLWRTLDTMEEQLDDPSAQQSQQQTCRILMAQLDRHTSKEDPIVFAHAEDVLTSEERAILRDMVENATLPAGWVCKDPSTS